MRLRWIKPGNFSLTVGGKRLRFYLHVLPPRRDSDGCPLRVVEWSLVSGRLNRMFGGEAYLTEVRSRGRS